MPRWKALPDELDPQVKEFTVQMRRLVDRSGMGIAALADRTGYSKTSWERYLGGRLLAPKGAVVALAEVTGTDPVHLTTMWELAERAWSRAELRHDRTMEAIRIARARAALGPADHGTAGTGPDPAGSAVDPGRGPREGSAKAPGSSVLPIAGPAGVFPTVPAQPSAGDADARERTGATGRTPHEATAPENRTPAPRAAAGTPDVARPDGQRPDRARPDGQRPDRARPDDARPDGAGVDGVRADEPARGSEVPRPPRPAGETGDGGAETSRKRQVTMFLAGMAGALAVVGAVFTATAGENDRGSQGTSRPSSPAAAADPDLPPGVKCAGTGCTGKDAEAMGCSGELVTTARSATVGETVVEVRYSETCGAAWGRITQAAQGDQVQVVVGARKESDTVAEAGDTIAYTPMVAVTDAGQATACVTLASGRTGCTR
ncbi:MULTISPECIES: helix-turn-helix domain-containing protein [Streptomyces]|uniref:DUF2690 domain-containing protein n=1 Tax=Streptomyces thermoviolaceus subsp. thermoviolaceus TaxID=66860 RepID=A0ABX0YTR3_STRTL|nr:MULTISPECIES: XRE family transcriptional regulator [Streptomyces]NJP14661.1 DUF2690 domain-containing protein [Streptomyces thermoviolaceus subsp. thermoviolaceus]RSS07415.1 DUF2690 domain-containing protein [Streptomyces sp. WAC00469]WTD47792.1 DUF2690 domain-containing protein [Streptomyces thermoviolaceus]GHA93495.1 hypothetical protein GCM10010512_26200 [Streptomyces thermoviolaceus subsp. thermoviolaceus]